MTLRQKRWRRTDKSGGCVRCGRDRYAYAFVDVSSRLQRRCVREGDGHAGLRGSVVTVPRTRSCRRRPELAPTNNVISICVAVTYTRDIA